MKAKKKTEKKKDSPKKTDVRNMEPQQNSNKISGNNRMAPFFDTPNRSPEVNTNVENARGSMTETSQTDRRPS
jgi:hypothetical protein